VARPTTSWKSFETRLARVFGGRRRGPDYRDADGGKDDVIHPRYSIEAKLLKRPTWGQILGAVAQSEANGRDKTPIAIVKQNRQGLRDLDALVCMRLETFLDEFAQLEPKGEIVPEAGDVVE
jgi:hypothetical protein